MNQIDIIQKEKNGFSISNDKSQLDIGSIHHYLHTFSYWAKNIPLATLQKCIEGSVCFGLYETGSGKQVGFARVITDGGTFAYLADVFILPGYQRRGLGKWLLEEMMGHPQLQGFRSWMLATRDAHGLYEKLGFRAIDNPERFMRYPVMEKYPENKSPT